MVQSVQISMDDVFAPVDGLSEKKVEDYFQMADTGRDGRIAGGEAMSFFLRTRLPMQVLSSIWQRVRPSDLAVDELQGLNRHQFSIFLRLVAFAQQGHDLQNEGMVLAAMDPDVWADMGYEPLQPPMLESISENEASFTKPPTKSESPSSPDKPRTLQHAQSLTDMPPIAYEVRYPPLRAKESAKLKGLIGVDGFLMAYPSFNNGVLIWGKAEEKIVDIDPDACKSGRSLLRFHNQNQEKQRSSCKREDVDAAQSVEVCDITYKSKKITCCYLENGRRILWVADKEGWVSGYSVANINAKSLEKDHLLHQWRASRVGHVTSMTVSINNELWTGNNRGVIRVWPHTAGKPTALSVFNPFSEECSRKGRELRKGTFDRAHSSKIFALHRASNGYTIWSISSKTILLWDAGSGMCFGAIGSESGAASSKPNFFSDSTGANIIEKNDGLELDPLNGAVLWRPARDDYGYCHSQQESWASLSERGVVELTERITEGAGKAVTFFGKLGGKFTSGSMNKQQTSKIDQDISNESTSPRKQKAVSSDIFAMAAPQNDTVWVGHLDGTVDVYSGAGKLLDKVSLNSNLTCMAVIGREVWIGTALGEIMRLSSDERTVRGLFRSHKAPVKSITQVGTRAYSLGADGSISGWSVAQSCDINKACWERYKIVGPTCFSRISLGVLAVTWNCGESRPEASSPFFRWIREHSGDKSLIVVSLQEVEMGGASVALAAAKETLSTKSQEKGNANAQFWLNSLSTVLGRSWYNVSMRQLSGMLIIVFARSDLSESLGEIHTTSVACGILGVGGNKGAVAVHLSLYRHRFVFICSHFAAHQHAIDVRNANYHTILQEMSFKSIQGIFDEIDEDEDMFDALEASSGLTTNNIARDNIFAGDGINKSQQHYILNSPPSQKISGFLKNIDASFWMGDFNYRIDGKYDQVCQLIAARELSPLLLCDQLKREHQAGKIFRGFAEPDISFAPTYKFDKGATGEFAYDSSEKRRVPAWCDRILYKGHSPLPSDFVLGTDCEVMVDINPVEYNSWMDVIDSDHKPVYGLYEVALTKQNARKKRDIVADILTEAAPDIESDGIPRFCISPHSVKLHPFHMPDQMVTIQNKGAFPLMYTIRSEDTWDIFEVEVRPAGGTVDPGHSKEIFLRANAGSTRRGLLSKDGMRTIKFIVTVYSEFSPGGSLQLHTKSAEFHALLMHDA